MKVNYTEPNWLGYSIVLHWSKWIGDAMTLTDTLIYYYRKLVFNIANRAGMSRQPRGYYLLDWYDSGKCCADPPVMSQTDLTKRPSVFFSHNMRRLNHISHICWLSQIRRCANLRSWLILPVWSCLRILWLKNTEGRLVKSVWDMTGGSAQHFPLSYLPQARSIRKTGVRKTYGKKSVRITNSPLVFPDTSCLGQVPVKEIVF